jgi:hypothetical protein
MIRINFEKMIGSLLEVVLMLHIMKLFVALLLVKKLLVNNAG